MKNLFNFWKENRSEIISFSPLALMPGFALGAVAGGVVYLCTASNIWGAVVFIITTPIFTVLVAAATLYGGEKR